ncbi:MAG: 4'-phosphopantetheinyl transferase superfamily protein [Bacteroidetes bacterium]|nr:4'-phosphopantetheinyl transferase superfamily protein [Fibrella sp.]
MYAASVTCTAFQDVTWLTDPVGSSTDELAVFRVALSDGADWMPHLHRLLSPDEIERAARYHRSDDRLRFCGTRGVLRLLLARCTHQPADRIEFIAGVNRKPELNSGWHFNVSHAGNWALIAIGKVRVGVDVEWINPDFAFRDVLQASFSPDEQYYINAHQDARPSFYQLWTRKEAMVKATGKGMDDAFARIPSLAGTHPLDARLLGQAGHWTVSGFTVADGYPAAVAHDGTSSLTPRFYTFDRGLITGPG